MTSPTRIELMTSFYRPSQGLAAPMQPAAHLLQRKPERVTITLPWALRQRLQSRADEEGRSLSNLMAHLLETVSSAK
jgi:hypothetical protein